MRTFPSAQQPSTLTPPPAGGRLEGRAGPTWHRGDSQVCQQSSDAPSACAPSYFTSGDPCQPKSTYMSAQPSPGLAPFPIAQGLRGVCWKCPGSNAADKGGWRKMRSRRNRGGLKGGQSSEPSTGDQGPEVGVQSLVAARALGGCTRDPEP